MSQPQAKKKGFIAPFQAPVLSQGSEQKGPDFINSIPAQDKAGHHQAPAKDVPMAAAATSSGASPATNKKTKKKKRPAAAAAGNIGATTRRPVGDGADSTNMSVNVTAAPCKPSEPAPASTIPDTADAAAAAISEQEPTKPRHPIVSKGDGYVREDSCDDVPVKHGGDDDWSTPDRAVDSARPPLVTSETTAAAAAAAGGDEACAPASEPALPVGSALTAASAPVDLTPPDAAVTSLSSPPAVFKRPNPGGAPLTSDTETGPPAVKRRLYTDRRRDRHGSSTDGAGRPHPKAAAAAAARQDQKTRLLALQAIRTCGTWVQCCHIDCGKWRYLAGVQDPCQIPQVWHCTMNDDARFGWCSAPQEHIPSSAFRRLVAVRFTVGSVVWAHLDGFPWWPAVVDDDPDTEEYFWLDGFSELPTHYHVTFLDAPGQSVTRAWVTPTQVKKLEPGDEPSSRGKTRCRGVEYRGRLEAAVDQARQALTCSLEERRRRFTFVARYPGPWPVYSDSDAETARPADGRRAGRKKRRDRRRAKTSGRLPPRASRSRSRSSSRSGSPGQDDETVNSLMDVVDDIVQQLTQSQSQSQSQTRPSHGDAGDLSSMFTDSGDGDSEPESPPELPRAAPAPAPGARARPKPKRAAKAKKETQPAALDNSMGKLGATGKPKKAMKTDVTERQVSKPKKDLKASAIGEVETPRPAKVPKTKKAKKAASVDDGDDFRENVPPKKQSTKTAVSINQTGATPAANTPKAKLKKTSAKKGEADRAEASETPKTKSKKEQNEGETVTPKRAAKPKKRNTPANEDNIDQTKPAFSAKKRRVSSAQGSDTGSLDQEPETVVSGEAGGDIGDKETATQPKKPKKTSPSKSGIESLKPSFAPKKKTKKSLPAGAPGDRATPLRSSTAEGDTTCRSDPTPLAAVRGSTVRPEAAGAPRDPPASSAAPTGDRVGDDSDQEEPAGAGGPSDGADTVGDSTATRPESGSESEQRRSPWLRSPAGAALLTDTAGRSPSPSSAGAAESSSRLSAPDTPSPRDYTELQSELAAPDQSQELFEPAELAEPLDGEESDPFEADD